MQKAINRRASRMFGWICVGLIAAGVVEAQTVGACGFDRSTLQFTGTPVQQAQCLLRPVARWGKVATAPTLLPPALEALVGQPIDVDPSKLGPYLAAAGVNDISMGGELDNAIQGRYFVIHDTSSPWLGNARAFPEDDTPLLNDLSPYKRADAVAHVFVGRTGQTLVGHNLNVPLRATKLEKAIGASAHGLFLHVELLQPRRRDPKGGPKNDAIAPIPGFTAVQYERLAQLYAVASVRAGRWLVPAFHAAIDEGRPNAHDDPQNFVLADFAAALERMRQIVAGSKDPSTPVARPTSKVLNEKPENANSTQIASGDACAPIVTALNRLTPGSELGATGSGSGGKTWKALYDECDKSDIFAGQRLPSYKGKQLRCSTDPNHVDFVSRYADGTVAYSAKASVDADGSPVIGGSGWPNNVKTWLRYEKDSKDTFINAEEVPFIVLPLPAKEAGISLMKDMGVDKGDLAVVVSGNRCSFALLGDAGPWFRLGEISMRAHEDLGNPQCQRPGQRPCKRLKGSSGRGLAGGVTYIVFPGTRPEPLLSQTVNHVVRERAHALALSFLRVNVKP